MPHRPLELPPVVARVWMERTGTQSADAAARKAANRARNDPSPFGVVRLAASDLEWIRALAADIRCTPPVALAVATEAFRDACAPWSDCDAARYIARWKARWREQSDRWRHPAGLRARETVLADLSKVKAAFGLNSRGEAVRLVVFVCRQLRGESVAASEPVKPAPAPAPVRRDSSPRAPGGRTLRDLLMDLARERGVELPDG